MCRKENAGFYVQMLGGFSVLFNDEPVSLGRKSTLKYIQMLQLIWAQEEEGIRKDKLIEALYGWSEVRDANNSVNNLLHQIRKHMVASGLPKGDYIILSGGVYKKDPSFSVRTDIQAFQELAQQGLAEKDKEKQESLLFQALELYQGELLPAISTEIWVIEKNLQLKKVFTKCVEQLGSLYRERQEHQKIEYLYEKTARIYPYDGWEIYWIDVLVERGEYEKAIHIYQRMTKEYMDRMGLPPTQEMLACYERINKRTGDLPESIGEIRRSLEEYGNWPKEGAYFCGYQSFVDLCHIVRRSMEQEGWPAVLMLCTLVDYEGKMIHNKEKRQERSQMLQEAIYSCVRRNDVFTKYNPSQYLILLIRASMEQCDIIYRHIRASLQRKVGGRAMVLYEASSLTDFFQQKRI